jgi:hypothetical protein
MTAIIIFKLTLCLLFQKGELPLQKVQSFTYKNKPVVVYKSNENKDIAYKIVLYADAAQNKTSQTLIIRKADETIKHQIGANYILSELGTDSNYINYPYGWESLKVDMKDLKEDCINIFDKKIQPLKTN